MLLYYIECSVEKKSIHRIYLPSRQKPVQSYFADFEQVLAGWVVDKIYLVDKSLFKVSKITLFSNLFHLEQLVSKISLFKITGFCLGRCAVVLVYIICDQL